MHSQHTESLLPPKMALSRPSLDVSLTLYLESSYGVIMTCNSCNKKIDDAIWYEAHLLCYPCYEVWDKADDDALKARKVNK